jgi:hypothetical protein
MMTYYYYYYFQINWKCIVDDLDLNEFSMVDFLKDAQWKAI